MNGNMMKTLGRSICIRLISSSLQFLVMIMTILIKLLKCNILLKKLRNILKFNLIIFITLFKMDSRSKRRSHIRCMNVQVKILIRINLNIHFI